MMFHDTVSITSVNIERCGPGAAGIAAMRHMPHADQHAMNRFYGLTYAEPSMVMLGSTLPPQRDPAMVFAHLSQASSHLP